MNTDLSNVKWTTNMNTKKNEITPNKKCELCFYKDIKGIMTCIKCKSITNDKTFKVSTYKKDQLYNL